MIYAKLKREAGGYTVVTLTLPQATVQVECGSWDRAWEVFKHLTDPYFRNRPAFTTSPLVFADPESAAVQAMIDAQTITYDELREAAPLGDDTGSALAQLADAGFMVVKRTESQRT